MESIKKTTKLKRKVSGGDLPDGTSFEMDVTLDYADVTEGELMELAFRSAWILAQSRLRKLPIKTLEGYAKTGYEVKVKDLLTRGTGAIVDYRKTLVALGLSDEEATKVLNDPEKLERIIQMFRES